jgi:hypothetical protein
MDAFQFSFNNNNSCFLFNQWLLMSEVGTTDDVIDLAAFAVHFIFDQSDPAASGVMD